MNNDDGVGWGFSTIDPTDHRSGGDVAQYALEKELRVFVREVLQNSNDERLDTDRPVEVYFRIQDLTGSELDDFFEALDWETWSDHLEMAEGEPKAERLRRFEDQVRGDRSLRLLTVEDRNTRGLIGAEDARSSNFTALVRDSLYSEKQDETAGGSFGLGASVLWTFSGLSTVLFNSVLSEPDPRADSPRFIGRTRLPPHRSGTDKVHPGHGWFGRKEEGSGRPLSVWGDEAKRLADSLHLTRPYDEPGTSAMVVGFRDPTAERQLLIDELAATIEEEAARSFWPAIDQGELKVYVETDEGRTEVSAGSGTKVEPFVRCLEDSTDPDEELREPGDVVTTDIPFEIPDKYDEETEAGNLTLCIRLAPPGDQDEYRNHVALFRGSGMVVKYERLDKVAVGEHDFHGTLVCGEARAWMDGEQTESDVDIEEFLRAAEPPEHDRWKRTEELAETYKQGFRSTVESIRPKLKDELRRLLAPKIERGALGPQRLGKRFPLERGGGSRTGGPPTERHVEGTTSVEYDSSDKRWHFEGDMHTIHPGDVIEAVTVRLNRMSEEGKQTRETISLENAEIVDTDREWTVEQEDDEIIASVKDSDGVTNVSFKGESEQDYEKTETRLTVSADVRKRGGE